MFFVLLPLYKIMIMRKFLQSLGAKADGTISGQIHDVIFGFCGGFTVLLCAADFVLGHQAAMAILKCSILG
jgi:hypothetical protein